MFVVSRLLPAISPFTPAPTAIAIATGPGATATATVGPGGLATASAFAGPVANGFNPFPLGRPCFCPEPPSLGLPFNRLQQTPDGKVHTPGGYTIEANGNTNWKITGPDGRSTRVEGDPHVKESDGGKWDFKRNSSFVLPDGTRVNVATKPAGHGTTVTSGLEVVNGLNRVEIDGVNTRHPRTSPVQLSGQQWNTMGWDRFTMGRQTDDWAFGGREIVGSAKHGDVLKVGAPLPPAGGLLGMVGDINRMLTWVPQFRPFHPLLCG